MVRGLPIIVILWKLNKNHKKDGIAKIKSIFKNLLYQEQTPFEEKTVIMSRL